MDIPQKYQKNRFFQISFLVLTTVFTIQWIRALEIQRRKDALIIKEKKNKLETEEVEDE